MATRVTNDENIFVSKFWADVAVQHEQWLVNIGTLFRRYLRLYEGILEAQVHYMMTHDGHDDERYAKYLRSAALAFFHAFREVIH
jgi:hypothetical protein